MWRMLKVGNYIKNSILNYINNNSEKQDFGLAFFICNAIVYTN